MQRTVANMQGLKSPFTALHLAPHLSEDDMRFTAILFLNRAQARALCLLQGVRCMQWRGLPVRHFCSSILTTEYCCSRQALMKLPHDTLDPILAAITATTVRAPA